MARSKSLRIAPRGFEEKRARIVEAFLSLAHRVGVANVRLQLLASEARCSYGIVHYYFGKDPQSLILAGIQRVSHNASELIQSALLNFEPQRRQIPRWERYVEAHFEWAKAFPTHMSFWVYTYYLCVRDEETKRTQTPILENGRQRLMLLLDEDLRTKKRLSTAQLRELAMTIQDLVMAALILGRTHETQGALAEQERTIKSSIRRLLS